jgi:hypothetical protein
MVRTVQVSGDQIQVRADIGPGRVISATLLVEDGILPGQTPPPSYEEDPFGKALDELLAATEPVEHFVDDSREAIYTPDEELQKRQP